MLKKSCPDGSRRFKDGRCWKMCPKGSIRSRKTMKCTRRKEGKKPAKRPVVVKYVHQSPLLAEYDEDVFYNKDQVEMKFAAFQAAFITFLNELKDKNIIYQYTVKDDKIRIISLKEDWGITSRQLQKATDQTYDALEQYNPRLLQYIDGDMTFLEINIADYIRDEFNIIMGLEILEKILPLPKQAFKIFEQYL